MHCRKFFKTALVLGAALLAGATATAADAPKTGDYTIRCGQSPATSSSGVFLAQEKGYFKELGLNVEISYFKSSGTDMTSLLAAGQLDVGGGSITAGLWNSLNEGAKIKLVADKGNLSKTTRYISLLVRKDLVDGGRFKTIQDLKGMKLGLTDFGTAFEIATHRILEKAGLTAKDVSFEKMGYPQLNTALQTKAIDAALQLEPYLTQAQLASYAVDAFQASQVYPGQQTAAIFYSARFAREHPDLAVKFMSAYLKGVRDYNAAMNGGKDRDAVVAMLKKHIQIDSDAVWQKMQPAPISPNGTLNVESLRQDVQWYKDHGYIQKNPNLDEAIDMSFAQKAVQQLGKAEE